MECLTISRYKKNGDAVKKNKKKHETFASANVEANRINSKISVFIKRVAYKCNLCEKYHVGTTFEMLKNKEIKPKHLGIRMVRLKVQGFIDESLLVKKGKLPNTNIHRKEKLKIVKPVRTKNSFYFNGGVWSYEIRQKTVKIVSPTGTVKIPKIEKEFDSNATIKSVKVYIRSKSKLLIY
jgi:hypothetical protein